jgi:hypothetical protein
MKKVISVLIGLVVILSIGFNLFILGSKVVNDNNTKFYQMGFEKAKLDLYTAIKGQGSVLVVVEEGKQIMVTELKSE